MRIILIIIVLFDYIRPFFNRLSNSKPVCKTGSLYVAMTVHMYFWSISLPVVCICMNIYIYIRTFQLILYSVCRLGYGLDSINLINISIICYQLACRRLLTSLPPSIGQPGQALAGRGLLFVLFTGVFPDQNAQNEDFQ